MVDTRRADQHGSDFTPMNRSDNRASAHAVSLRDTASALGNLDYMYTMNTFAIPRPKCTLITYA